MTEDVAADRYDRQQLIEGWDQQAVTAATVVLLGIGALGNELAKNLALAGVGRLILCDPDVVDTSNLSRSALFTPADVGRPKVSAAAAGLRRIAPATITDLRPATLTAGVGLGELADAAVAVGCLDSRRARVELLGRAALVDARLVDGGTGPWSGEVRVRGQVEEPCYACSLSVYDRGETDLPRSCAEAQTPGDEPASIATTALVAAWMTVAVLRLLMGRPVGYPMLRIDAAAGTTTPIGLTRDPDCPHHQPLPPVDEILPVTDQGRVRDLLAALPPGSDPVSWINFPIVLVCRHCGHRTGYPEQHRAEVPLRCVRCGGVQRPRTSNHLADADPAARLSELSVAPQEILPVRTAEGGHRWIRLKG